MDRAPRIRVLILEDNPSDADLMADALRQAGLDPQWERVDLKADFEARLTPELDLILSDYSLPQFNGVQALQLVRARGLDVPFILVSGTIGEDIAVEAMRNGADDYLLKDRMARLGPAALQAIDRKRLRDDMRCAGNALRDSEERFRAAFEQAGVGMALRGIDPRNSRWLRVNQKLCDILGYTQEELLQLTSVDITPPEDRELAIEYNEKLLKGDLTTYSREKRYLRKDGRIIWANITLTAVSSPDGRRSHIISVIEDITDRKLQKQKIEKLLRVRAVSSAIDSILIRVSNRQELFQQSCRVAVVNGQFPLAWIGVLDPATQDVTPVAWAGEGSEDLTRGKSSARDDTPRGLGAVGRAIRERRPVINNDITAQNSGGARLKEILRLGFRSQITLPLFEDRTVVGTLTMYAREPNFFDEEELKLLTELAGDISFALEHMARQQKIDKLSRIRAVSSEINAAIVRIRDRNALLKEACRIATERGRFEMVWVAEIDMEKQGVQPVAWTGFSKETAHAVSWATISTSKGTLREAIQTRKPSVRNNIEAELPAGRLRQEALKAGCLSTVCLPLVVDDNVVALIALFASGREFFDPDEMALLDEVAADVSFALQTIAKQEHLDYLSYYDPLTGLPNRTLYLERLGRCLAAAGAGEQVVVMLGDTRRLRMVNETLGRQAGDEVLRQVAKRLADVVRNPESLARISADWFATFVPNVRDIGEAARRIEQIRLEFLRDPFPVAGRELTLAFTLGAAVYPGDGKDAESLLANAEAALKKAKATGESLLFYEPSINARVAESLELENKLRRALEKEQFVLHYQPKIDLASGRICGLEALIRWNDPETGLVPPVKFIPLLEETGMILDAGRWAMRQALRDYREWTGRGLRPPRIAVNVSPIQLRQKDFVEVVRGAIGATPAEAHGLDLEITESLIMEDIAGNIEKLRAIRDMEVKIGIDDFGTGYSSLGYLAKLPVNALKIDRSFIITMAKDPDSMAIVSTIISLAHSLNLTVVAEGVDSEDQRKILRLLRCDEMQGYLFSKPLPASEIEPLLRTQGQKNTAIVG